LASPWHPKRRAASKKNSRVQLNDRYGIQNDCFLDNGMFPFSRASVGLYVKMLYYDIMCKLGEKIEVDLINCSFKHPSTLGLRQKNKNTQIFVHLSLCTSKCTCVASQPPIFFWFGQDTQWAADAVGGARHNQGSQRISAVPNQQMR